MRKEYYIRVSIIISLMTIFVLAIVSRLFTLQIVEGESYQMSSLRRIVKTIPAKAQRGDILDRYGRTIVTSQTNYNLEISRYKKSLDGLNETIYNLLLLLEKEGYTYIYKLPISQAPYGYTLPDEDVNIYLKKLEIKNEISADEVIKKLKARYKIADTIPANYVRNIISVRAEMEMSQFSQNNPFVFAKNVNINIVTLIKENDKIYPGVNIITSYERFYEENVATHILGRVGPIYKEEYDQLKKLGYGLTDIIGKDGIEKIYDLDLKGKDGILKVEQDELGKIKGESVIKDAIPGNDVILTLDLNLQKRAEKALKEVIDKVRTTVASDVGGGSVVVLDIHTGEVLAMASYPSYNIETFDEDYEKNVKNPLKPFWNRSILGTYAPGSTFKMLTSVAILEENIVSPSDQIYDKGKYTYYDGYQPVCDIYPGSHGLVNVAEALRVSCNYFFYDTGRRLGIDKLYEYGKKFGLGEYTGIEIPGEAKGIMAGPIYRQKTGGIWYPGDTLQASIGQSDNLVTPLQLVNYVATVVNGGTRFKTHLLSKIKNFSNQETSEVKPVVLSQTTIRPANYKAIMEGMRSVTEDGTASNVFKDFSISVGGKTGTTEVPGTNNGLFVAFAPYDNPKIAISVVVEHGAHGNTIAPVAKEIIDEYFNSKNTTMTDDYMKFEIK
jgi:penicillin-binding protein 2